MGRPEGQGTVERGFGRRKEDFLLREKIRKHALLFSVGQIITSEMHLNALFEVVMDQTNQMMGTQRSTVFLHDESSDELWSLVATGMNKNEIRISSGYGVAGWVFQNRTTLIINDAYSDPRFYSEVDRKSGFRTKNILCVPLFNQRSECIGALQALNKNLGDFSDDDAELLKSMSHYVAIALENSKLYEDVNRYSERLKQTLIHIETLEKVKSQLTKFVPSSVARMVEEDPDRVSLEKIPMKVTILFIDLQDFSKITQGFDQTVGQRHGGVSFLQVPRVCEEKRRRGKRGRGRRTDGHLQGRGDGVPCQGGGHCSHRDYSGECETEPGTLLPVGKGGSPPRDQLGSGMGGFHEDEKPGGGKMDLYRLRDGDGAGRQDWGPLRRDSPLHRP